MKSYKRCQSLLLTLSAIASTAFLSAPQAKAVSFAEQQVSQEDFTVVAVPFGYQEHRLEIIEQIPGEKQCWNESGVAPVTVDLLLLDFDHTDSCRRVFNTNGYTLRLNGKDDRVARVIKIVPQGGELKLMAYHKDPAKPDIEIGSTNGMSDGAMKIILNPGWQITKRVHQGAMIDHLYLSGNTGVTNNTYSSSASNPSPISGTPSNSNTPSNTASNSVNQGTANTNPTPNPTPNPTANVDTQVLVNSVDQIYNNIVTPLLQNLSQPVPSNQ
ncbi:MAG: DUF3747 domain-containing protein [Cyanobacteria bacterium P01_G01_bin.67]